MNASASNHPAGLRPGDYIGLIAPAGAVLQPESLDFGIGRLEDQGYRVKVPDDIFARQGYLAGSDRLRADQFTRAWLDPETKALLAVRGGFGCSRMLEHLNLKALSRARKTLIGFSDISILLNFFAQNFKMTTYHGPMLSSLKKIDQASRQSLWDLLAGRLPQTFSFEGNIVLVPGRARGVIRGGNLACLVHLLTTPYEPAWDNTILLIEDTGEAPYQIDRYLTQLHHGGRLQRLAGLILGSFTDRNGEESRDSSLIWERARELTGSRYPVWANLPVGHGRKNQVIPIGREALMDSDQGILTFL